MKNKLHLVLIIVWLLLGSTLLLYSAVEEPKSFWTTCVVNGLSIEDCKVEGDSIIVIGKRYDQSVVKAVSEHGLIVEIEGL